jgi:hypothetical protein
MRRRWLFLALVVVGALLFANQFPPQVDVRPFPAPAASVRLELPVRFAGDYRVELSMPKVDDRLALRHERFPCDFLVSIEQEGQPAQSQHVESIRTASEFGWANTQTFVAGEDFRLGRGTYAATIAGGSGCQVATARGASITIARVERERILGDLLVWVVAVALILAGLLGLTLSMSARQSR